MAACSPRHLVLTWVGTLLVVHTVATGGSTDADFASMALTSVPDVIPADTTSLTLHNNSIGEVEQFPALVNLTVLTMSRNNLPEFPDLQNVSSTLLKLVLSGNNIVRMRTERLQNFVNLSELNLNWNKLTSMPEVVFPALTILRMSSNDLIECPRFATFAPMLQKAYLSKNPIIHCDDRHFGGSATTLLQLRLGGCPLDTYRLDRFASLTNLALLDLSGDMMRTLPSLLRIPPALPTLKVKSDTVHCADPMLRWTNFFRYIGAKIQVAQADCFRNPDVNENFSDGQVIDYQYFSSMHHQENERRTRVVLIDMEDITSPSVPVVDNVIPALSQVECARACHRVPSCLMFHWDGDGAWQDAGTCTLTDASAAGTKAGHPSHVFVRM